MTTSEVLHFNLTLQEGKIENIFLLVVEAKISKNWKVYLHLA